MFNFVNATFCTVAYNLALQHILITKGDMQLEW
jgi:hypothetical protein